MSRFIHKSHNVSVLLYHIVCPAKYRRVGFRPDVDRKLKEICLEISKRYEITSLEIGTDKDPVHFLAQSVPMDSPEKIVQIIKSMTAREIFAACPEVKKHLWGGECWTAGDDIRTVGQHGNERMMSKYIQQQGRGKEDQQLQNQQLKLF